MKMVSKLAKDLRLDETYIESIINRSNRYYKDYVISKRNGGSRLISQASAELKTLQYWVVENVLKKLPVSPGAFAYKIGDSIKKHATFHSQSKYILHLDIKNFFPSITIDMVNKILREHNEIFEELDINRDDAIETIDKICFRDKHLCIGTVSSPIISNVVMYDFDCQIIKFCDSNGYKYSRYADDMYISSNSYIPNEVVDYIADELKKRKFIINREKTRFSSTKYKRKVTGVIITTDSKVSIGTKRRNEIKKMVYDKLIHGKGKPEQIKGYLSFLKDIEPQTYNNIIIKYSKYCKRDILKELFS